MAKSYNQTGSLRELLGILKQEGVNDFSTLNEIRSFQYGYKKILDEVRVKNTELLAQNISALELEYKKLSEELMEKLRVRENLLLKEKEEIIPKITELENKKSKLIAWFYWIKKKYLLRRRYILETDFHRQLEKPFKGTFRKIELLKGDIDDKKTYPNKWIDIYSKKEVDKINFTVSLLEDNKNIFYGAEGEEKAVEELSKLPDSYSVVNDYRRSFNRPLYDKRNGDLIHSIQIDHIVVGPTGVYIIETKNWSKESVESRDLFSPVKQLMRTNYVMFVILNNLVSNRSFLSFNGKWGNQQISPKNFILLMNHKPVETYQFVKIVTLSEINNHLMYGDKIFSEKEVEELVEYLIDN